MPMRGSSVGVSRPRCTAGLSACSCRATKDRWLLRPVQHAATSRGQLRICASLEACMVALLTQGAVHLCLQVGHLLK